MATSGLSAATAADIDATVYEGEKGKADAFEALYHTIANDLAEFRNTLTDKQRLVIRQIAEMRFAADMVPDAFVSHLT